MGRFNIMSYRPRDDSTPGVLPKGVDAKRTVILARSAPENCPCGCDQPPKSKGRTFGMGHDARLRGKLIRAHLSDTKVVFAEPDGKDWVAAWEGTALMEAKRHDWDGYLREAQEKQGPSIAARLAKANGDLLAKATGPQVGDRRVVKVGRWSYTGQLMAVFDDGDDASFDVEYVDKKGATQRTRVPKAKVGEVV